MNIFYLHPDPVINARMHLDKHVVKMILEYAQLLSTAHRVIDGTMWVDKTANGRSIKRWRLDDSILEDVLYKATHINHPSAVWCRESLANYEHLYNLFIATCDEYTYRYGKFHKTDSLLRDILRVPPKNIKDGAFTEPTPAMPDEYIVEGDSIQSYHNYYNGSKTNMFAWKKREIPAFINTINK